MSRSRLVIVLVGLLALVVFGLLWAFVGAGAERAGVGWYLFAYAMGLTMIVLPCTLPLAFVIVPLALGKGPRKGLAMAIAFGIGVAITLSLYGVLAAVVGKVAIGTIDAPLETVKNWVYFIAGIFALLFALGEVGLVRWRMPTYTGAIPAGIQRQSDYFKAFFLGLFLGNIGVGCPHPATPLILTEIASSGDIFYGWTLFLVHAIGRVLPLLVLVVLGLIGVNGLQWLLARKEKIERSTGWVMVFVAGFILVLGLFTHDWWVNSGIHTTLEAVTQEERFLGVISSRIGAAAPHQHGLEEGRGLFGLPLAWGNWVLVLLWIIPLWWYYLKKKKEMSAEVRPWRFWFTMMFSILLIVTFTYILPDRFYRQAMADSDHPHEGAEMDEHMDEMMDDHPPAGGGGHDDHGSALYHEESEVPAGALVVNFRPEISGQFATLNFLVNETNLEIEHERLMHVIAVRDDLGEFTHIHPVQSVPGVFTLPHTFTQPGRYKFWSQIKTDGVIHTFGHPILEAGPTDRSPSSITPNFGRNVIVDNYQVALEIPEKVVAGREVDVSFDIHSFDGHEIAVENYLGAPMHLAIISEDLKQFLHTHPEEGHSHGAIKLINQVFAHGSEPVPGQMETGDTDEVISFHVTFPEPGLYKMFGQFRPAGLFPPTDEESNLRAEFWVQVEAPTAVGAALTTKPALVTISLVLMLGLGLVVRKFIA